MPSTCGDSASGCCDIPGETSVRCLITYILVLLMVMLCFHHLTQLIKSGINSVTCAVICDLYGDTG